MRQYDSNGLPIRSKSGGMDPHLAAKLEAALEARVQEIISRWHKHGGGSA